MSRSIRPSLRDTRSPMPMTRVRSPETSLVSRSRRRSTASNRWSTASKRVFVYLSCYRLEARQAALRREMALLRERVSGGDEGGNVARPEAGQRALQGEIMHLESVLAILFDRFIEPGRLEGRD